MNSPTARRQRAAVVLTFVAAAFVFGPKLASQGPPGRTPGRKTTTVRGREAVEGEVLVKFVRGTAAGDQAQLESQLDTEESEQVAPDLKRMRSRGFSAETLLAYLQTRSDVAYAEPNYILHAIALPNDTGFSNLWGLLNVGQQIGGQFGVSGADIHATSAWDVSTGSKANVVAVIDTGIDYTHEDLAGNVWSAPTSFTVNIGGTNTTCPAGSHGYNAITKTCDPKDDNNHGSHVSGTIGAVGNNGIGVAGVNWTASIMASKFLDASGSGTLANAVNAIEFTIQAKAKFGAAANVRVLSNSWGGGGFSQSLLDEITKANANGMLFVAAAGNANSNNDVVAAYPADYTAPNVIAVAATDNTDHRASFSNYGATRVQIAAPGVNILSTTRNNTYSVFNGTSMATPHVSGAAALVLSHCALDTASLKATLISNVDSIAALTGLVLNGGRLNVDKAIRNCIVVPPPPPPAAPTGLVATAGPQKGKISLDWANTPTATSYIVRLSSTSGGPYTVDASGLAASNYTDTGLKGGQRYYYVVAATSANGTGPNSAQVSAVAK